MYKTKIGLNERIHFIGIGGIGMSGLAQVMNTLGFKIQGSDISRSKNVERCKKIGIKIFSSHNKKNINNCTIIVKSSATKPNSLAWDSLSNNELFPTPESAVNIMAFPLIETAEE